MLKKRSKSTFSQLVRCITWFSGLKDYNYKTDPKNTLDPICRGCGDDIESTFHLITTCPSYNWLRLEAFQSRQLDPNNFEWKVEQLARFLSNNFIKTLEVINDEYFNHWDNFNHLLSLQNAAEASAEAAIGLTGGHWGTSGSEEDAIITTRFTIGTGNSSLEDRVGVG